MRKGVFIFSSYSAPLKGAQTYSRGMTTRRAPHDAAPSPPPEIPVWLRPVWLADKAALRAKGSARGKTAQPGHSMLSPRNRSGLG